MQAKITNEDVLKVAQEMNVQLSDFEVDTIVDNFEEFTSDEDIVEDATVNGVINLMIIQKIEYRVYN